MPAIDPTRFILIGTSHPGNVGAAARALKVMGFTDLVLVRPRWSDVLTRDAPATAGVLLHRRVTAPCMGDAKTEMTVVVAEAHTLHGGCRKCEDHLAGLRVEREHARVRLDFEEHVEEHALLALERARQRELRMEVLDHHATSAVVCCWHQA